MKLLRSLCALFCKPVYEMVSRDQRPTAIDVTRSMLAVGLVTNKPCRRILSSFAFVCLGTAFAGASNPAYEGSNKPVIATVNILAISTSIHDSSGSEQVYLAYIALPKAERQLVRLIDTYPIYEKGIRTELLEQQRAFRMTLLRDADHDISSAQFYLPEKGPMLFDTSARETLQASHPDVICTYLIMHNKTRLVQDNK